MYRIHSLQTIFNFISLGIGIKEAFCVWETHWSVISAHVKQQVWSFQFSVPPCKEIRIPGCGKGLLVKSRIGRNFARWIRNRGLWNPGIQLKKSGISLNDWNPESEFHWQRLESSMWNPNLWYGVQIQDHIGFPYIELFQLCINELKT